MSGDNWFESEPFWKIFREVLFDPERLLQTPSEVDSLLGLLKLVPQAKILDLACGFGRHSLELARRGFGVTGLDLNAEYLSGAQADSRGLATAPEWVLGDMREFRREGAFDAVLSLYTSFGYFDEREDDEQVLQNAFDSLRSGGQILLDLPGKELIARDFIASSHYQTSSGAWFICEREPVQNWERVLNNWTLIRDSKEYSYSFEQTLFSAYEITLFLHGAGFSEVTIYGNWAGDPYNLGAERLIAVGKKV